ncbi:hypothetical protein [Polyangium mundeleinium]|uniref:Uncharacterized protein n=1 Tax=Polyangium mundeleinium TaxID=2995306 RepID=A0ABT5ETM1_9BACT|nr:hypothetical protein [Polyangium mundeleinium]MDC0745172.1 hypothetical protein [Polyangium mundeleinium]
MLSFSVAGLGGGNSARWVSSGGSARLVDEDKRARWTWIGLPLYTSGGILLAELQGLRPAR